MHDEGRESHRQSIHVLMAGGGTGGHVFPALAIAAEPAERGDTVSWVGRQQGMEENLVREAGLSFHALEAKPWVGKGLAAKIGAVGTLVSSSLRGRALVRRVGADVVLGTGGYVSTPAVLGARLAGRRAFLLEPNARAGAANRLASRWCVAAFVAHEETAGQLRCKAHVSGIPVRRSFHEIGALPAGDPRLLILGGSQGALQINRLIPSVVRRLSSDDGFSRLGITHQTGRAHSASVEAAYAELGLAPGPNLEIVPFIDDMAAAMATAHLVISRAGALASAELAAAGRPAILIPLTAAGAGHQRFNAEQMESAGAAVTLADAEVTSTKLGDAIARLLSDRSHLEAMATAARSLAHADSAARIADVLEEEVA
ncbi:MAG: undecaprenyldiphospho-muramoylpentapeptide beta-N-acetylglucosaminyltransferase [bacterium]|nr:undecaprenyldiphospho-muramoylpentapeptide beta-N-acetylglucosaminyltransferase [bacterium]